MEINKDTKSLVIIGGGPAGISAGVYAARKKINTSFITKEYGGQSSVSPKIQNWIGEQDISGIQLAENLKNHIKSYQSDDFLILEDEVVEITKSDSDKLFVVKLKTNKKIVTEALLICIGAERRKLPIKDADAFEHKGLTYCATCDGPLFANQDVVVIGGGNAGFETALQLLAYAKSVTLLHRGDKFKADKITVEKTLKYSNMTAVLNANITEILKDKDVFVSGIKYKDSLSNPEKVYKLDVTGIFVEIGLIPSTKTLENLVELDNFKRIKVDPKTQLTSNEKIWAAGDCTNTLYQQNNIAAGDAIKAIENIYPTTL